MNPKKSNHPKHRVRRSERSLALFFVALLLASCSKGQIDWNTSGVAAASGGWNATSPSNKSKPESKPEPCIVDSDENVSCWGDDSYGQLDGTPNASTVSGSFGGGFISIYAGGDTSCAVDDFSNLKCWGQNNFGQLGDGFYTLGFSSLAGWRSLTASRTFGITPRTQA